MFGANDVGGDLEAAGLSVSVKEKTQSATAGLLHGVDKPLTAFTLDGSIMAVFDRVKPIAAAAQPE